MNELNYYELLRENIFALRLKNAMNGGGGNRILEYP
jgi:hypothetical protein